MEEHKNEGGGRINIDAVAAKIRDKSTYYRGMVANGWFMPSEKSSLSTVAFMSEVRSGATFCYKLKDVKFLPCAHPPSNETLRTTIVTMIRSPDANYESNESKRAYLSLAQHLEKKNADQSWLLGVCSTMNKDLDFFQKNYRPPRHEQQREGA